MTHNDTPPVRKKIICDPVATARAMPATGRRPRSSASRPPISTPTSPGIAVVTVRKAAISVFEKPRMSVRYLFVNCDDGPLKRLVKNATTARRTNRRPFRRRTSPTRPRTTSVRAASAV